MNYKIEIINRIESNSEVVGVIGLGYVGLPLAVSFAQSGVNVLGFDVSELKVNKVNSGENYIKDIKEKELKEVVNNNKLTATSDFSKIARCDALIICVPTPLDKFKKPNMSYIEEACVQIGKYIKKGVFISLESTTYPTTTESFMLPIIEKESGLKQGEHFWLAYSPERVDPGNQQFHTRNTPKVLGAMTKDGLEIGQKLYKKAVDKIHIVSSPRVAEMVKILENTYRLVNISLINELALLSGKMNVDIWEVIEAAKTKPFGFQPFYPGPGIGGHCIPLDPFYLEYIAKQFDFDLTMINTAGHINMRMPHYMYIKIATALNNHKKPINGSRILFLGVAYKPNIDDERESAALEIMKIVLRKGGIVSYNDPHIPTVEVDSGVQMNSVKLTKEVLKQADCVVLTTRHNDFDVNFIKENAPLVVDLQNMIRESSKDVYKL